MHHVLLSFIFAVLYKIQHIVGFKTGIPTSCKVRTEQVREMSRNFVDQQK